MESSDHGPGMLGLPIVSHSPYLGLNDRVNIFSTFWGTTAVAGMLSVVCKYVLIKALWKEAKSLKVSCASRQVPETGAGNHY